MTKICRDGEICGGSQHVKTAAGWEPCACYYFRAQARRFLAGGFSERDLHLTAEEAITQSCYGASLSTKADPVGYVRRVAEWLIQRPAMVLRLNDMANRDSYALGAYFALQAALSMDVVQATGSQIVDAEFDDRKGGGEKFVEAPFLLLYGFGGDNDHVYLRTLIWRVLQTRTRHRRPTVVAYAAGGSYHVQRLYGEQVLQFLTEQKGL